MTLERTFSNLETVGKFTEPLGAALLGPFTQLRLQRPTTSRHVFSTHFLLIAFNYESLSYKPDLCEAWDADTSSLVRQRSDRTLGWRRLPLPGWDQSNTNLNIIRYMM